MSSIATRPTGEPIRLWWTFVGGLLLWALILAIFGHLVGGNSNQPAMLPPVDAQLVELPPEAKPAPAKQQVHETAAKPRSQVLDAPPVKQTVDKTVAAPTAKANPVPEQAPAKSSAPANPPEQASAGSEKMGARAIYQPLPTIPDELRDEAIRMTVMARFHINPDGSAMVELIKASSNPRINQLIMNTLKTWKFFPAIQGGKPVPSTQDIKVNFKVD